VAPGADGGKEESLFFFEKKNQKTFVYFGFGLSGRAQPRQSKVFCFFFSKKKNPSLRSCWAHPVQALPNAGRGG
jgi:hypothetical protein